MGFESVEALLLYCLDLSLRGGGKPLATVVLPRAKCPPGVIRVVGVRCKTCRGTGAGCPPPCGFGFRFFTSRKTTDHTRTPT